MRTLTNSAGDTVVCFDANVYTQERNLIQFTTASSAKDEYVVLYSNIEGSNDEPIAKYYLDKNRSVVIDVSAYIRANASTLTTLYLECQKHQAITISVSVKGLLDPAKMVVPAPPYDQGGRMYIVIPMAQYKSSNASISNMHEFRATNLWSYNDYILYDSSTTKNAISNGQNAIKNADTVSVSLGGTTVAVIRPRSIPCDVVPACVEWVGATGTIKRATWLVKKHTISVGEQIDLAPTWAPFRAAKGRTEGVTIYLDELSRYDYWYYSDIVTSSDVRVLIGDEIATANIESNRIHERFAVSVETKNVTIPDGDASRNSLEINLKKNDYAAVL